jgi:Leucine-rich repeat (LRR) protein
LLDTYEANPQTEYINLSDLKITDIEPFESFFGELKNLKDISLEDNQLI